MKQHDRFADASVLQLTLREVRALFTKPSFWGILFAGTVAAAVAAPFNTGEAFSFIQRLIYWFATGLTTYPAAMFVSMFVGRTLEDRGVPELLSWGTAGFLASIPVVGIVLAILVLVVGVPVSRLPPIPVFALQCAAISVAVVAVHYLLRRGAGDAPTADEDRAETSPLQSRLPVAIRGPVQHLEMQDHYVRVTTAKGSELILMRMADAMAELSRDRGLQVHRSHWVAVDAVASSRREKGRIVLTLVNNTEVPVSRSHAASVKDAGLA